MNEKTIILRLTIVDPVPDVAYSLQNKAGAPVSPLVAGAEAISFDVPVRVADGPRFLGDFVRSEGPSRRFIYIAIGAPAGQHFSPWSRRAKVDITPLPAALLEKALGGAVLEVRLPGRDKANTPACATVRPIEPWRVVA